MFPTEQDSPSNSDLIAPQAVIVDERFQFDFSKALATRETEHRLAESKAKAEFERDEIRKDNESKRRQLEIRMSWELWRTSGITVVMVVFIAVVLAFSLPLVRNPDVSPESRQLGIFLLTTMVTGGLGFLVGKGTRKDDKD